jgi:hypothetical protein
MGEMETWMWGGGYERGVDDDWGEGADMGFNVPVTRSDGNRWCQKVSLEPQQKGKGMPN